MKKDQVFSSALFSLQLNRSLSDRPDESVLMEQGKMMGRRNVETDSAIDQMAASLQPTEKKDRENAPQNTDDFFELLASGEGLDEDDDDFGDDLTFDADFDEEEVETETGEAAGDNDDSEM